MTERFAMLRFASCCLAIASALPGVLKADDSVSRPVASAKTREQGQEALQREVYGLSTERNQLLSAAIEAEPQSSLPRWYQGQVQGADGQWKSTDKPVAPRDGQLYREYADLRNTKPDDAVGQYFVGEQRLLSHDNTPQQPTRMIVPGLAAE